MRALVAVALLAALLPAGPAARRAALEVLTPVDSLPAQLVNRLDGLVAAVALPNGGHLLLDRRTHAVYSLARGARELTRILGVGEEAGYLLSPEAMSVSRDEIVAVIDAPRGRQRIQYFTATGATLGGFLLPVPPSVTPRITSEVWMSTVGTFAFTGKTFLVSEPAWGSLFIEIDTTGTVLRHVGQLRLTGHEAERDLHLALNVGLPIVDPTGGFYFVFQTGVPTLRKYDPTGGLVFERHIEGPELDGLIQSLPTSWPRRADAARPLAPALVRTAATDARGRLWISLRPSVTYVYDPQGNKERVVAFQGASTLAPLHFSFSGTRLLVIPGGYVFETAGR